ncbi:ATP-binding protein [Bordetella genomosp. 13]|uniref:ATP-binding protein n=1 Tax=Bordetella genomosp. 13 TaxID=463040 RepID=UPI0011A13BE3|nr:ATP-binding protein [Bordetella genomosp. 13]
MPNQPDTLALTPDANAVTLAAQWLEGIAEREGWSPKATFGLTLSLDEALTNIVSYAFRRAPADGAAPAVTLACRHDGGRILLDVADNGEPYDPTQAELPDLAASLDDADIGGHGTRLMRHYLQELVYARDGDWNRLTMAVQA